MGSGQRCGYIESTQSPSAFLYIAHNSHAVVSRENEWPTNDHRPAYNLRFIHTKHYAYMHLSIKIFFYILYMCVCACVCVCA